MKDVRTLPLAVALRWDGDGAPRVTAKGRGEVAERILALAHEHKVPLREDRALVAVLSRIHFPRQMRPGGAGRLGQAQNKNSKVD